MKLWAQIDPVVGAPLTPNKQQQQQQVYFSEAPVAR